MEYNEILKKMQELVDTAKKEDRSLSAEEVAKYDDLKVKAEDKLAHNKREKELKDLQNAGDSTVVEERAAPKISVGQESIEKKVNTEFHERAFIKKLCKKELSPEETRTLNVTTSADGGYTVPTTFLTDVEQVLTRTNRFRALGATVMKTDNPMKKVIGTNLVSAGYIAEGGTYAETDTKFAQLTIDAFKIGGVVKVSEELLRDSFFDVRKHLVENIGMAIAVEEEKAIVAGTGSSQPLGLVNTSDVGGISVPSLTLAGTAAITADELREAVRRFAINPNNQLGNKVLVMSANTFIAIEALKDANNRYLIGTADMGLKNLSVPSILNIPVIISDHMQDMGASKVPIVAVNTRAITIADRAPLSIQQLQELYALTGWVGFRFSVRQDSVLTNANALYKVVNAAV